MAKRPNILKLATKISLESMTYMGITYDDPEYKILEPIIDDDMCAIMMHVRLETNRTVEEVAKRARKSVEFTQEQLDKLCKTGAVRYRYVDGKRCYFYPIWVPGIMEGILANREQCDKYPVLGESFEAYTRRRPEMLAPMLDSGKTGMFFMRVMPLIENATAISVGPCSCRRARRLMGEGCGHLEEDMCMYLNDNARCFSEQGYHRLVSKEEAYEILKRAEDNGLVHEINQTPGFEDTNAICNCCGCCCEALGAVKRFQMTQTIHSNFIMQRNESACVNCGRCVQLCPVKALTMERDAEGHRHIEFNAELCLGCGVCTRGCNHGAITLVPRPERTITPLNTTHRAVVMATERGNLQDLIFDNRMLFSHRLLAGVLGAILKMPAVKRSLAQKQLKSRFIEKICERI